MKKTLIIAGLLGILSIRAQTQLAYTTIREADVVWSKTIWRKIDLKERINFPYYFPLYAHHSGHLSLFNILKKGVLENKITPYSHSTAEGELSQPMKMGEFLQLIAKIDTITVYDVKENGEAYNYPKAVSDTLATETIMQYYIKETWFFDKQRSVMDVRIMGICPVKYDMDKDLLIPLFWVSYPQCRAWLSTFKAVNGKNDGMELSFDQLFMKRKFNSVIIKESNVYDRFIHEYAHGIDGLLESERVKESLLNFELDMWEY